MRILCRFGRTSSVSLKKGANFNRMISKNYYLDRYVNKINSSYFFDIPATFKEATSA